MDQIRQCMDNKEPSRVKFRRAEPDPPLLAVRLGSGISLPVYGALRIGLVPPPPKNLFIPFSLLQAKRYAPLVPPRVKCFVCFELTWLTPSLVFMSPDFLTFIEEYRNLLCLWKVRSAEYSNKFKRDTAWEHLLQITKEKIPNVDTNFVKKKVDNLRAAFRKKMRKVRDSTRSGASADDPYTPTLWYFELMKFTAEQEQPRKTKSNLNEDEDGKRLAGVWGPLELDKPDFVVLTEHGLNLTTLENACLLNYILVQSRIVERCRCVLQEGAKAKKKRAAIKHQNSSCRWILE
ncbi:hypothetical protein J6590_082548 [Homalodisca vitripennis]|nr:hypothetical protein J6590_082548 [Homalodisca vitripennis]